MVRWQQMPPAAMPPAQSDSLIAAAQAGAPARPTTSVGTTVVWMVFLLALGVGGFTTWRILRRN